MLYYIILNILLCIFLKKRDKDFKSVFILLNIYMYLSKKQIIALIYYESDPITKVYYTLLVRRISQY